MGWRREGEVVRRGLCWVESRKVGIKENLLNLTVTGICRTDFSLAWHMQYNVRLSDCP